MNYTDRYLRTLENVCGKMTEPEMFRGEICMITGATGMIGSAVADLLLWSNRENRLGLKVLLAVRDKEKARRRFRFFREGQDYELIGYQNGKEVSTKICPDTIIHCAGNAHPNAYAREPVETLLGNVAGMYGILDFARKNPKVGRVLYVSSSEVYGDRPGNELYKEEDYSFVDILNPRACCPSGKRAAETLCSCYEKEYGVHSVIVRPGHIYGPTMTATDSRAATQFIRNVLRGEPILMKSAGLQRRSYCYVFDCASAILTVLKKGADAKAYNISNPQGIVTIREFAEVLSHAAGLPLTYEKPDDQEASGYNLMTSSALDSRKLESLGWKGLYDTEAGIRDTLEIMESGVEE